MHSIHTELYLQNKVVFLCFIQCVPQWMEANPGAIKTGNDVADNIITVLLSTSMFVAGVLGFVLDNTIPGTPEERGLVAWKKQHEVVGDGGEDEVSKIYDIPLITPYLKRYFF